MTTSHSSRSRIGIFDSNFIFAFIDLSILPSVPVSLSCCSFLCVLGLTLLWQILSEAGFPNQFFNDSWVVGFWRGRPWLAGRWIGKKSLDVGSSRFWIGWVIKRGGKCARSTYRG